MAEPEPAPPGDDSNLSLPIKLDAFVFNAPVCNGAEDEAKIAPITQPNYTFLRLTNFIVQNDILNPVDLHHTTPPEHNSRLTDLGTGKRRANRQGVYLHWMLPRVYRSGTAATDSVDTDTRERDGIPEPEVPENKDTSAPQFRLVPTRWLVVRRLHPKTAVPDDSGIPELEAWIVESDRRHDIKSLGQDVDLQTDVSPFVFPTRDVNIETQAEIFIGHRYPAKDWVEVGDTVPRVPLSLLNGGNVLFADYQPHNSNVFSIVDNFSYPDPKDPTKKKYLESAKASYYVIGWHPDGKDDPLHNPKPSRADRVGACLMELSNTAAPEVAKWLESDESARILCHGAMYNVEWDVKNKPKCPADTHSKHLISDIPIAVGTTPLDSLLAYIRAHEKDQEDPVLKEIIDSILHIQTLLIDQDDSVDSQKQAMDQLNNYNYDVVTGGTHFYLAGSDNPGRPAQPPTPGIRDKLAELNREQYRLDLVERTKKRIQWELFAWWWKFVCDVKNTDSGEQTKYRLKVEQYTKRFQTLDALATDLGKNIGLLRKNDVPLAQPGVLTSFYEQRDPTVLIGGIESGWPHDYLDKLKVRLDHQITSWTEPITNPNNIDWTELRDVIIPKLPEVLRKTAKALVGEFFKLMPNGGELPKPPEGTLPPQFHDQGWNPENLPDAPWRDDWGHQQPWFPLFMEWEVEYTHVPIENWSLEERGTVNPAHDPKVRYGIKDGIKLYNPDKPNKDKRTLSGRVLILPQPSFSLNAKINQLFDNTPPKILDDILDPEKRKTLQTQLYRLAFLSAPLAGLHDHLLTMVQGTHIKPNVRHAGEKLLPIEAAINRNAGFKGEQFTIMGTETDLTPYGTLVQFHDYNFSAFKPVTHGQFKFTKLNIVDKFGQAIHAIDPRWSVEGPPSIYPCIGEFYATQALPNSKIPNTVTPNNPDACEYVQMGPHINQLARINAAFVKRAADGRAWVPQTEWENPIWGWIVINYADYGLQVFLPDGTFYREVRVGGRTGATTGDKWLPFPRPPGAQDTQQLDHLLTRLADKHYLQAFVDMINDALMNAAPAPDAYAQFLNSVVGKPLALVNMGWSLEMAADAYENQSTLNTVLPDRWLLPDHDQPGRDLYSFHVKLGDKQRTFDGLVGYFDTQDAQISGNDLILEKLFTYFESDEPKSPLVMIGKDNYPILKPFFIRPDELNSVIIENKRNSFMRTFGAIVDPFTPVHAYSGILPTTPLKLPTWTWQDAMNRMTAFFHMGPLVVTEDVPVYDEKLAPYKLKSNYNLKESKTVPGSAVAIPALPAADWNWLQPYMAAGEGEDGRVFVPFSLGGTDGRPKFEMGPYTTLEGYLQLSKPIVRE
ncbi:hypothetical protein FN846DRAFT_55200 [Sphaerosporella brunnea]|uniref:Uncharacterized protein n=1 Tax=Sphaerosporella brunnea TaxID=1250544 RepID=A0A5J5EV64_9PEZI|nr:hypothetical protein FN846DRAFT_55200 [Sphaerosporella brunnea]